MSVRKDVQLGFPCNYTSTIARQVSCGELVPASLHARSMGTLSYRRWAFCPRHGGRLAEELALAKFIEEHGIEQVLYE